MADNLLSTPPQAVLNAQYSFRQGALACRLRSALTCLVHDKTLLVSSVDMAAFSSGEVQTLMSVDADRVVNLFSSLHELWSLPLQIAIALCLLYTQVTALSVQQLLSDVRCAQANGHALHRQTLWSTEMQQQERVQPAWAQ